MIAEKFEDVFKNRMLEIALKRRKALHIFRPCDTSITSDMVVPLDENKQTFMVCSVSTPGLGYEVDTALLMCTCVSGKGGKFCKHLAAIEQFHPDVVALNRMVTPRERYELAVVAVGCDAAGEPAFYGADNTFDSDMQAAPVNHPDILIKDKQEIEDEPEDFVSLHSTAEAAANTRDDVVGQFTNMINTYMDDPNMVSALVSMGKALNKMKNRNVFCSAVHMFGKECVGRSAGHSKKIRVQPTGIARRSQGKPRGATALTRGKLRKRKVGEAAIPRANPKRARCLSLNVALNRPNAKSHGSGH